MKCQIPRINRKGNQSQARARALAVLNRKDDLL